MDHSLLTRFNLPSGGSEAVIRASKEWLTQRVALFERYCLPSVQAQNCTNFGWVVYFDPESPAWLRERIDRWAADSVMSPVFRASVTKAEMLSDIENNVGRTSEHLMTTNLDNDDALAVDFVERLQSAPRTPDRTALYLARGLIYRGDRVYARRDPVNAFCSVREDWDGARMCWTEIHNRLSRAMPVQVLEGAPAWLQVIHGANVSNRVRGRLVSPAPYRHLFPGLLEDIPVPTRGALARDQLIDVPRRSLADSARQAGKAVLLKASGGEGLERTRLALAKLRHRSST
jgi:hypothetical protein